MANPAKHLGAIAIIILSGCLHSLERGRAENEIVVISPHDETIRREISIAFEKYSKEQTGKTIKIRWQPARGTGNILRLLENEKKVLGSTGETGIDVFWGGGVSAHEIAGKSEITDSSYISEKILRDIPEKLAGIQLRDENGKWYGVTLSSFGIIFNKKGLIKRGIKFPSSWKDLARPEYEGLIILADPAESGSARACYEMILQRFGWEEGWKILHRIIANAGSITHSSSDIAKRVSAGQALAGMVIDTYAFAQIEQDGNKRLGFVLPAKETAFTPDPVSVIKGTPRKKEAITFIEFLLSKEGQMLWIVRRESEDGRISKNLWHFPVRPDIYNLPEKDRILKENPYLIATDFVYDEIKGKNRNKILTILFETTGVQNRKKLNKALNVIKTLSDKNLEKIFDDTPVNENDLFQVEKQLNNPAQAELVEERLFKIFREKYEKIIKEARFGNKSRQI